MNIDDFNNELKQICKKWYFDIPIIGKILRRKSRDKIIDESSELVSKYLTELHKQEFNNKTKEQQFEVIDNVINYVFEDLEKYTKPNWNEIYKEVRSELYNGKNMEEE